MSRRASASAFDPVAVDFERHRSLPEVVTAQLAEAVRVILGPSAARLLDLGAGTGRLGRAFLGARNRYVGVDRSLAMLDLFRTTSAGSGSALALADGRALPFGAHSFGGVLLAHVLSASGDWSALLAEACRVLDSAGVLILVQREGPEDGLDARLRQQLRKILATMSVEMPEAGRVKGEARAWLASVASSHRHVVAARWTVANAPRDFVRRHSTGVRFRALPAAVQRESMERLGDWAAATFGAVDAAVAEEHRLELDAFRLAPSREDRVDG